MIARLVVYVAALRDRLRCRLQRHDWVLVVDTAHRRTYLACTTCHVETTGLVV